MPPTIPKTTSLFYQVANLAAWSTTFPHPFISHISHLNPCPHQTISFLGLRYTILGFSLNILAVPSDACKIGQSESTIFPTPDNAGWKVIINEVIFEDAYTCIHETTYNYSTYIYLLGVLTNFPFMTFMFTPPREVVVLLLTLHKWDNKMSTIVS